MYEEALKHNDILGLIIATRPDCIDNDTLDYLENLVSKGFYIKLNMALNPQLIGL